MKVVEIFDSIDGEGIRAGQPATFIRLAGCNLRCSYCDTAYALFGEDKPCDYTEMSPEEIAARVNKNYRRVTLTGGEPLIHRDCAGLCGLLLKAGIEVNIETNGAADIAPYLALDDREKKLFFTIDYKLPSSGVWDKMLWDNFLKLRERDAVKFVVGSDGDVRQMLDVAAKLKERYSDRIPHIFVGAVYGMYSLQRLAKVILEEPVMSDARIQLQLHKIIWNPDERGV